MTPQEAREILRQIRMQKCVTECDYSCKLYESETFCLEEKALDMAIKALEQEPCDDCISRADALKAIEEQKKGFYGVERYAIDECHSAVMKLPSVRPYKEIVEDKRACENCIHYVTRDSKGVVLCGCDSWECDFEEVKT